MLPEFSNTFVWITRHICLNCKMLFEMTWVGLLNCKSICPNFEMYFSNYEIYLSILWNIFVPKTKFICQNCLFAWFTMCICLNCKILIQFTWVRLLNSSILDLYWWTSAWKDWKEMNRWTDEEMNRFVLMNLHMERLKRDEEICIDEPPHGKTENRWTD